MEPECFNDPANKLAAPFLAIIFPRFVTWFSAEVTSNSIEEFSRLVMVMDFPAARMIFPLSTSITPPFSIFGAIRTTLPFSPARI